MLYVQHIYMGAETNSKRLLSSGWTPYHGIKLIVPLIASISPMLYARLIPDAWFGSHHVLKSLGYGVLTTMLTYVLFGLIEERRYKLQKAVLLGLLVSELTIFHVSEEIPSVVVISFYLFMYLFGLGVDGVHDDF